MDTVFATDDISTDTIFFLSMTNAEKALLGAVKQAEYSFLSDETQDNAERYIVLADTLKCELTEGYDLCLDLVGYTERGDLNCHNFLDVLKMTPEKKRILAWILNGCSAIRIQSIPQ